jgi:hypothetical protein
VAGPRTVRGGQSLKPLHAFTWEAWDARATGDSESHGFGSTVLTVLQDYVLGISVSTPGAANVDVRLPHLMPMHVTGVYVTQRGRIPISWSRAGPGRLTLDVTIPPNVSATVHPPASNAGRVFDGAVSIAHRGRLLASFDGPGRAIRCAQAIREATEKLGIELRMGLHTGECEVRGNDLAGLAMHIAARVGAIASSGEILVSSTVKDLAAGPAWR